MKKHFYVITLVVLSCAICSAQKYETAKGETILFLQVVPTFLQHAPVGSYALLEKKEYEELVKYGGKEIKDGGEEWTFGFGPDYEQNFLVMGPEGFVKPENNHTFTFSFSEDWNKSSFQTEINLKAGAYLVFKKGSYGYENWSVYVREEE